MGDIIVTNMAEDDPKELAKATLAALRKFGRRPPLERFNELVARGLIDSEGRVLPTGQRPLHARRSLGAARRSARS